MSMHRRGLHALAWLSCATVSVASEPLDYFGPSNWNGAAVAFADDGVASPSDRPVPAPEPAQVPTPVPTVPAESPAPNYFVAPSYACPPTSCGTVCDRSPLLGEWCGVRPALADSGVTMTADVTQFYFGVMSGGIDREFRYAGHGDYVALLDGEKLLGLQGFSIKLRAEHRWGESIARATGSLVSTDVLSDLPVADSESVYLTNVLMTQALSENFAVYAGKLDTLGGDANAFASGRGKTQFSNVGFVVNPVLYRYPYSTLGAGFIILDEGQPIFSAGIMNAIDTANSAGFDDLFANGAVLTAEGRLPTCFLGMPGHQLLGGAYSTSTYNSTSQDPRVVLPNVPTATETGSWSLYYNFDQYVETYDEAQKLGWGVFGRAGIADQQTNPFAYFISAGVGGDSPIWGRQCDTFGAGWFYAASSDDAAASLAPFLGPIGDGQSVELFYNIQVTPWMNVTPDFQVVIPARESVDTALVGGIRANISL